MPGTVRGAAPKKEEARTGRASPLIWTAADANVGRSNRPRQAAL